MEGADPRDCLNERLAIMPIVMIRAAEQDTNVQLDIG